MGKQDKGTCVSILDKDFRIACPVEQTDSLKLAAGYLDKQMRQIRRNGRVVGTESIAVMAALHIAYELITLHQGPDAPVNDLGNRIKLLQNKIDNAIISVQVKKRVASTEVPIKDSGDTQEFTQEQESETKHASSEAE